jgi:signal transduction histidine kinase
MSAHLTIRTRLTVWYSAVLFAVLVIAGIAVVSLHRQLGLQRVDRDLESALQTVAGVLHNEIGERLTLPQAAADMLEELQLPGVGVAVLSTAGQILASTNERPPQLSDDAIRGAGPSPSFVDAAGGRMRRRARSDRHGGYASTLVVWTSMQPLALESATLQQAFLLGVPIALALASFGGSLIAKHSLRPLDESLRLQRAFMADASHQLRTPVSVIRTAAQVTLSRPDRTSDEYRESLEIISRQSQRLTKMVDDMFMLAMVDAQGRPPHRLPLYLNEIVDDVVRDAQPLAVENGITVTSATADDVPFSGDEDLLRQMIWNLVENAVRHSPPRGSITLSIAASNPHIDIVVADEGPGIPAADRARIFDRFVRLEGAGGVAGAGLGLPIARWIAEAHGGTLTLDESSRGCRFRISLPIN